MSAVGSRVEYASDATAETVLAKRVFAVISASMKLSGEDSVVVSPVTPVDRWWDTESIVDVKCVSGAVCGDVSSPCRSAENAFTPSWAPVIRALAISWAGTGGSTPNGVATFGGPVDQP